MAPDHSMVLLMVQRPLLRYLGTHPHAKPDKRTIAAVFFFQLLVGIYGGYFGAGMGILMLSSLAFVGIPDIHQMNAVKSILAATMNGVSAIILGAAGAVRWDYAVIMAIRPWPVATRTPPFRQHGRLRSSHRGHDVCRLPSQCLRGCRRSSPVVAGEAVRVPNDFTVSNVISPSNFWRAGYRFIAPSSNRNLLRQVAAQSVRACSNAQMSELRPFDFHGGIDGRHSNDLLQGNPEDQHLRHRRRHVLHAALQAANMSVGRDRVRRKALLHRAGRLLPSKSSHCRDPNRTSLRDCGLVEIGQQLPGCRPSRRRAHVHVVLISQDANASVPDPGTADRG